MLSGVFSLCVYNRSILALQPANTPYHPSGPYRDLRRTADTRHSYYVCAPAVMVTPAHDDRERTLRLRIRLITPVSHDARYAASGTSVSRSSSTYVYIYRIFFSRHASWARVRFGQPNPFLVLHAPLRDYGEPANGGSVQLQVLFTMN